MDNTLDKIEQLFAESARIVYLNKRYGIAAWSDRQKLSELRDIYNNQKELEELSLLSDASTFVRIQETIKIL